MEITENAAIQGEQSQKVVSLDANNIDMEKVGDDQELNEELIIDNGNYKITVSCVGTLDMKKFIEVAMRLPSFRRSL